MSFEQKLEKILARYQELNEKFLDTSQLDRETFTHLSKDKLK